MPERPFFNPPRNVLFYDWGATECQLTWEDESVPSVLSGPLRAEGKTQKFAVAFPHLKMPGRAGAGGTEKEKKRGEGCSQLLPANHKAKVFPSFFLSGLTLCLSLFSFFSPLSHSPTYSGTNIDSLTQASFAFYFIDCHHGHQGLLRCSTFPWTELIPVFVGPAKAYILFQLTQLRTTLPLLITVHKCHLLCLQRASSKSPRPMCPSDSSRRETKSTSSITGDSLRMGVFLFSHIGFSTSYKTSKGFSTSN